MTISTADLEALKNENERLNRIIDKLLPNREWLASTLRSIGDAVIATSCEAVPKIIFLNPIAEELTGWKAEEAVGKPLDDVFNIVHMYTREKAVDPIARVLREGKVVGLANHTALISRSGREYIIEDSAAPIFDADNKLSGVVLVFRDTTAKHAAEDLIAQSNKAIEETKLDLVDTLESMSDAFFSLDKDWNMVMINQHMVRVLGTPLEKMLGKNLITTFFPTPELRQIQFVKQYEKAMATRKEVDFEEYYQPFEIWLHVRAYPKSDGGLAVFFTDITESKKIQMALVESETNFRTMADSAPQIIWTADPSGAIDYANSRWYEYTRLTPGETMGSGYEAIVHPDDLQNTIELYAAGIRNKRSVDVQHRLRNGADGSYRWFLVRALPKIENGELVKWYGTITDIHEQKILTEELAKARDEAELANETKSAFLANMSHEIRTPLGAILGFTDLLRERDLSPDDRQQFLDTISRNGKALTKIIDDILDLAKVESGKLEVEKIEFSFLDLLDDVVDLFRERTKAKAIYLRTQVDRHLPPRILSDPTRIRQILINIIGNAVKFTEEGGVLVDVRHEIGGSGSSTFYISVSDTGPGLSIEQQKSIFQPFVQADNSTTRKFGGTGLGLVLSRRLAKALGGDVSLEDCRLKEGCTFKVTFEVDLPKIVSEIADKDPTLKLLEPVEIAILSGIRILVADDSQDNLFLVKRLLTKNGASVELASNGLEAFKTAMGGNFDLVLMDIQMPVLGGYEATSQLRDAGFKKPIIALTAHAMAEERARSLAAGCNGHLTKPLNPKEVVNTIALQVKRQPKGDN